MKKGKYEPTTSLRFYPGASMSLERKTALDNFEVDINDATSDDILYCTARAYTKTIYAMLAIIEERWGKEAAREVAHELGYRGGKANLQKWLRLNNVTKSTPELISKFQDLLHGFRGPDHARAFSEYDDKKCVIKRTGCAWHTGHPEGMDSYCKYSREGFFKAYKEVDPSIKDIELLACMSKGDSYCEFIFWFDKKQGK